MLWHNLTCMSITRNLTKLSRTWQDHRRTLHTARLRIFSPARPHHMDLTALGRNRPGPAPPRPARPGPARFACTHLARSAPGTARPGPTPPGPSRPSTPRAPTAHHSARHTIRRLPSPRQGRFTWLAYSGWCTVFPLLGTQVRPDGASRLGPRPLPSRAAQQGSPAPAQLASSVLTQITHSSPGLSHTRRTIDLVS